MRHLVTSTLLTLALVTAGCSGSSDDPPEAEPTTEAPVEFDQALSDELVQMQADDQSASGLAEDRQARLAEIFDEYGWPGRALVGEEGSTAAWVIAQHADLDPAFQERALELLTEAVAQGDASAGDLAYLSDRVAVAQGEEQTYGTQIRCVKKKPVPPTPIADPASVDALRAEAGLDPLAAYLEEMRKVCQDA